MTTLTKIPPGARLPENMEATSISFTPEEINFLNTTFAPGAIVGSTYLQR